ncbi:hypothetical protein [Nocardia gipuzkoensis]
MADDAAVLDAEYRAFVRALHHHTIDTIIEVEFVVHPRTVRVSYRLRANAYVTKPVDLDRFMNAIKQIDGFYIRIAALPAHTDLN